MKGRLAPALDIARTIEQTKNNKEAHLRPNSHREQAGDAERYCPVRIRIAPDQLGRYQQHE